MEIESVSEHSFIKVFNTPLEVGVRCLMLLSHKNFEELNTEDIMYLDYLILNTADIQGPPSIHAPIPNRRIQLFSKKKLIEQGIKVMLSKALISVNVSKEGFKYHITEEGKQFLIYFESLYYKNLTERIQWIAEKLNPFSGENLRQLINNNFERWGSEVELGELPS